MPSNRPSLITALAPGMLVAATGVGAGDLLTASLAGAQTGLALLWAAVIGAAVKWSLNEGIARWQMGTGTTVLEGWSHCLGRWVRWVFLIYFLLWSLMVGSALANACGVAATAIAPLGEQGTSRVLWSVVHSLGGIVLVWLGGFRLFQRLMSACIAAMFAGVLVSAVLLRPDWTSLAAAFTAPQLTDKDLAWALAVLGGVGGTVTLLSYGYWIREAGRSGLDGLKTCRLDLAVAYAATAMFGVAMIFIGSRIKVTPGGGDVAVRLAEQLGTALGPVGQWLFLLGFWAAVFSSLLGVWQSAPYLFADFLAIGRRQQPVPDLARTWSYRLFLLAIGTLPLLMLGRTVTEIQRTYSVMGALFMPLLALTLLVLNNGRRWLGTEFRNGIAMNLALLSTLILFAVLGWLQLGGRVPSTGG